MLWYKKNGHYVREPFVSLWQYNTGRWGAKPLNDNNYKHQNDLYEHPPSCLEDFPDGKYDDGFDYYDTTEIINWKNKYHDELSKIPKQ